MNTKVKNENFIVIQGYMINELNLKGNELLIYAIITGFSQDEGQVFSGSLQYLAEWTNSTKQSVIKCLKSLIEKGHINKNEKFLNGVKFCEYYSTKFNGVVNKVEWGGKQSLIGGSKQSLTNNIDINNIEDNINNKIENIYTPIQEKKKDEELLKEEFDKLWELYPKKVGKEKSFTKYKKYRTSKGNDYCTYEEVFNGLERYLKYVKQNSWYSPADGSTWFNNKRWNDEYNIKEDDVPEWFDKKIEPTINLDSQRELEDLVKGFR